ncbi:MAG: S46 family peptidase [Bacteroidetes bacterium]|nr:S46 family peptidase [Bacteroidota bacterium]
MKKIITLIASAFVFTSTIADEGMWLPMLLKNNYEQMVKQGLKLTPEQLYDINNSSLKDAIAWFNGGCTSEIISDQGLLLTNHHCGYDAIATHSTTADNILDNGFWAKSFAEEKPNQGMWVSILHHMEDVSDRVNKALEGITDAKALEAKKAEIFKAIQEEAGKNGEYMTSVKSMFKDNAFYLFVFEKFTDIRLVAAPPQSVGKFGGDTDNWMWPRHTGDFSMFRIYANKDNKPANYSKDNVPYKPKKFLPVSIKGLKEDDYTMVYGFPGRTNRYETSFGVQLAIDKVNPTIVKLRDARLSSWKEEMVKSDSVRLLLSADYASIANYWKFFIGQTEQLKRMKVVDEKLATEKQFAAWAKGKPEYENVLSNFENAYKGYQNYALHNTFMREGVSGSSLIAYASSYMALEKLLKAEKPDQAEIDKAIARIKANGAEFYKQFNLVSEQKILAKLTQYFYEMIPADQHPQYLTDLVKKNKGKTNTETFEKYAKKVFEKSFLTTAAKQDKYLTKPDLKKLQADPAFAHFKAFYDNFMTNIKPHVDAFNAVNNAEGRKYMKGLMAMNPGKLFYPDANGTLRLTYGNVRSYAPKDGVQFGYYTTLEGVMEKENPKDFEFIVPARLKELYKAKDYGQYANEKGELPVAIISNNDITGGNSGSPVINGNGELVGLAFDGNWEAMSGDIYFDSKYKRTISNDIRYILFMIDKFGGATNLINEMKIVK